jgi:hypothetical protein
MALTLCNPQQIVKECNHIHPNKGICPSMRTHTRKCHLTWLNNSIRHSLDCIFFKRIEPMSDWKRTKWDHQLASILYKNQGCLALLFCMGFQS